ncbi:MAG: hypothetical protein IPG91_07835 [Ideonella sp.]|nr:hypothetical protein [Ideonella sp.]
MPWLAACDDLTAQAVDRARKGWERSIHGNGDAGVGMRRLRALRAPFDSARRADREDEAMERLGELPDRPRVLLGRGDAGVGLSLHSDVMVTDPNPLHTTRTAVTRRTCKESDLVLATGERIPVESAIPGWTTGRHSAPEWRTYRCARGSNAGKRWLA